uniref:Uncharacterized protein n=1 Tax=Arundo donax TaxID=35708 RepID=A0A0A8Z474_ARUDO
MFRNGCSAAGACGELSSTR